MPTPPPQGPDDPRFCEECREMKHGVKYDRPLRRHLCGACWASSPLPKPKSMRPDPEAETNS
jgi:hypothetical protein